jgi:D-sedoheptulose 7-phosphate isomerase
VKGLGPFDQRIDELVALRTAANRSFFAAQAEPLSRLCHRMAERFAAGGRLVALGLSPAARSDVRHVAVEFVHPVIVGKRALPAIGLSREGGALGRQVELVVEGGDVVLGLGLDDEGGSEVAAALATAAGRGALTVAFGGSEESGTAEWRLAPPVDDPFVRQELVETCYHVLWELVHVFFEHRGLLAGRTESRRHDAGASSFLYPFLGEQERDLEAVVDDVRRSVLMKAEEIGELRRQTLTENRETLAAAARSLRRAFVAGRQALVFGNGGSATDAMDLAADLRSPPPRPDGAGWPPRRALDLTEDASILTAVANDVGIDAVFARQVIAYGRPGDVALGLSTSGGSGNVLEALGEARRRGLGTIALAGYGGGRVAAEGLADQVVVTRSEHVPRIQEAQAAAYHVLRELVEHPAAGEPG